MQKQPRYGWQAPSPAFPNGSAAQAPPEGTVSLESAALDAATHTPPPVDIALLRRGRERYDIYCSPCHGFGGDADGVVVRRGFPKPPSFHSEALRQAPARHIFDVITHGYGVMYSFSDRVPPRDRWAIAAYIRALQQARDTTTADAPEAAQKIDTPARTP
jgi:mono/diheme cytochrome c family protein